jgi:hypothetical protein
MTTNGLIGLILVLLIVGAFIISSSMHILRSSGILQNTENHSRKEILLARIDLFLSIPLLIVAVLLIIYFFITRL